jgi:hypothetical protein
MMYPSDDQLANRAAVKLASAVRSVNSALGLTAQREADPEQLISQLEYLWMVRRELVNAGNAALADQTARDHRPSCGKRPAF